MGTAKEALEILRALLTLEYHNKNYLSLYLTENPSMMNKLQLELVEAAIEAARKDVKNG